MVNEACSLWDASDHVGFDSVISSPPRRPSPCPRVVQVDSGQPAGRLAGGCRTHGWAFAWAAVDSEIAAVGYDCSVVEERDILA